MLVFAEGAHIVMGGNATIWESIMKGFAGFLIVALSLLLAGNAAAQNWTEARPPGGNYRIEMPRPPQTQTKAVDIGSGKEIVMHIAHAGNDTTVYMVMHGDYPSGVVDGIPPEALLSQAVDGATRDHTLRRQQNLSVAGHPGREFVMVRQGGIVVMARITLVGRRLYQLMVISYKDVEREASTRKFFESFALTDR